VNDVGLFESLPPEVSLYEVSLRDGLQNERATVLLRDKLRLADALASSGLRRIELTSFVSPKWIPQLADADELAKHAPKFPGVTWSALCPNERGLERAVAAGTEEIAVFMSASETHNQRNVNKTIAQTLATFDNVIVGAVKAGIRVRGYVSTAWGCPYEGQVPAEKVLWVAQELRRRGCYQISLGDTIGCGTPRQTRDLLRLFFQEFKASELALHMHDTRGTALANVLVGLEMGIRDFDASVAGMGGCPYAPGAAGNLATEDLVYMLDGMGVRTGVDLEKLVEAGRVAESLVGRTLPGKVHQSGIRSLRA
jgi:hydroxymethylglutaryl-CoA lyase